MGREPPTGKIFSGKGAFYSRKKVSQWEVRELDSEKGSS